MPRYRRTAHFLVRVEYDPTKSDAGTIHSILEDVYRQWEEDNCDVVQANGIAAPIKAISNGDEGDEPEFEVTLHQATHKVATVVVQAVGPVAAEHKALEAAGDTTFRTYDISDCSVHGVKVVEPQEKIVRKGK